MNMQNERTPALLLKMKALRSGLSKSEQRVVDYIMENPEKVVLLSVAGLAESSKVSDATVIRTCRRLGMAGYQELKLTLAQDIVTPLQNIHEEVNVNDDVQTVLDKVFQSGIHALTFTHDTIRSQSVEEAVDALMAARRICIIGLGNSNPIAVDFQHKMMRLGMNATAYTDSHMQAIAVSYLTSEDLVFAISHSGSSKDIVDSAKLAKENGAKIISLTNIGSSPLEKIADIQLYTAARETRYRVLALSSRLAQMAIIDTLYTCMALKSEYSIEGFHKLENALAKKKY